jgi:hypothetical protein
LRSSIFGRFLYIRRRFLYRKRQKIYTESPGEGSGTHFYIDFGFEYIERPPEKAGETCGAVFLDALYISRDPGERSGRVDSPKIGAGGLGVAFSI